jgi:two-component system sensor histidine kinase RpfC
MLEALGTPFQPAGNAPPAFVAGDTADLWCRAMADDMRPPRAGRDLIVWGEGTGVDEALVVLSADADLDALRRAVRAALIFATEKDEGVEPARRIEGAERSLDVLVADDHRVNRQVIERLLAQGGHRAILADCGETALAKLAETAADVVVLDLNMPRLGGLDVARRLVERPDRPRLVALTADATAATRAACEAAGFDAFLTKPVDGSRLLEAVETGIPPRAAAPVAPAQASIDHRRLDLLRQLDQGDGFLDGIIAGFIEDGRGLVDEIESAAAAGDPARFRDAAHAMRSAATHLGATALFERCLAVKSLEAETLSQQAPELGRELRAAFEQAARELDHVRTRAAPDAKPTLTPPSASSGSAPSAPSCADPAAPAPAPARSTVR